MTQLAGARALVTGANGGIGRAIARALKAEGAELVLTGRREDALAQIASEVGGRMIVADLAVRDDTGRILSVAGDVDVLVANAAVPADGDLGEWTEEQLYRAIEINLASPLEMTRALLPKLRRQGSGHFVYISSLAGKVPSKGAALYSATKFALRGFSGALRADLAGSGVGCSVVFPGFVRDAGMYADTGAKPPFGMGTVAPEAVAAAVVKAIRSNRAEIDVAPIGVRAGALIGSITPALSASIQSRIGNGLSEQVLEAHRSKR
ncbi:MAG TPA: SDR family NAD(P)-dependent oxidoreductase [Acidimicrobiales bacterium]|nr:SDR family NAD(P)-dependent oxidoreductase [Acidimicrobiales bacterium]